MKITEEVSKNNEKLLKEYEEKLEKQRQEDNQRFEALVRELGKDIIDVKKHLKS